MKYWEKGMLHVSENKRYLEIGDSPFFWLGDTAWLLFHKCSLQEAYIYLKNRKEKGYNVIQATLIHMLESNHGERVDVQSEAYWEHCDKIISMAEELGLYMALLPSWGSFVKGGMIHKDNVEEYGDFLAKRYGSRPNIIWLLGGDVRGNEGLEVYPVLGRLLKKNQPNQLVGFHPFGRTSSSLWFHDEDWLDFNMFQSGHRNYSQASLGAWDDNKVKEDFYGEDSWRYVIRDHSLGNIKPTVDGEPSYEGIPQGLHDENQPYWKSGDVRRYAYWSVLAGAMGFTYGSNAVMQFYNDLSIPGSYGAKEVWQDAIHHEGSSQMVHMIHLMMSVDFTNGLPKDELLASGQKERYARVAVFAGADYVLCYDYLGTGFELDLSCYGGNEMEAYWFDPSCGIYSYIGVTEARKMAFYPVKRQGEFNDWVLVVRRCML